MALSMKGLTRAGKTLAYSARGDPRLLEVVRKSIRLIEDTIKLSVAHGIVNCGTPSLEMLDSLANFSEHTSPAGRESILLGIRRGIFTWSMGIFTWSTGKEILSLKSLLEAYRVGHREQVECAKLQKIFIHGGPLPKGWTAHWRPDRPYFVNHNSKLTTWMDPRSNPQSQNDPSAMRDGWLEFAEDDNAPMAGFDGWEKRSCRTYCKLGPFYRRRQNIGVPISQGSDDALNSGGALPPQDPLHEQENTRHITLDSIRADGNRSFDASRPFQFQFQFGLDSRDEGLLHENDRK